MTRDLAAIATFALAVIALAGTSDSGVLLNAVMMTLYAALLAQAWNILGGCGGQMSFGHALFFGVGAYTSAIAQINHGWNAWAGLAHRRQHGFWQHHIHPPGRVPGGSDHRPLQNDALISTACGCSCFY